MKRAITISVCGLLLMLGAGCSNPEPSPSVTPLLDANGKKPVTTADPEFKNNPNVPEHYKKQVGGGGQTGAVTR